MKSGREASADFMLVIEVIVVPSPIPLLEDLAREGNTFAQHVLDKVLRPGVTIIDEQPIAPSTSINRQDGI